MKERLQKLLSAWGVASRRQAEQMILDGRVTVNGVAAGLGDRADPAADAILVDGQALSKKPEAVYVMLHKPRGYVTTLHDEQGRRNVAQLVTGCGARVYPVGRLDLNSEGLLLLTNDGAAAQRLSHPSGQVEKVYLAWVQGYRPGAEAGLRRPLMLDGRETRPAQVSVRRSAGTSALLEVRIGEGRNRQVRRLCEAAGLRVTRLKRIAEGKLTLGDLPVGAWRYLTEAEIAYIQSL